MVGLDAFLTKIEKILHIPQVHIPPQAILSGFWPFCPPAPHYLWIAGSRMEPGYGCYL